MPFAPGGMPHHDGKPSPLPIHEPESGADAYSIEIRREALRTVLANTADSIATGAQRAILSEWGATINVLQDTSRADATQDPFRAAVPNIVKWIKISGTDGVENTVGLRFTTSRIQFGGMGFMQLYTLQLFTKRGQMAWNVHQIENAPSFFRNATTNPAYALKCDSWRLRMALVLSFLLERAGASRCDVDKNGFYVMHVASTNQICKWEEHSFNYCWAHYGRGTFADTDYNFDSVQDVIAFGNRLQPPTPTTGSHAPTIQSAILRVTERLACVLESKGAPTQEQLVDGIMKALADLPCAGPDRSRLATLLERQRAQLDEPGKRLLLERLNEKITSQRAVVQSREKALEKARHEYRHPTDTRYVKTLNMAVHDKEHDLQKSKELMQLLKEETRLLTAPPNPPPKTRKAGKAPTPAQISHQTTRK